jgi:hypothetical protein
MIDDYRQISNFSAIICYYIVAVSFIGGGNRRTYRKSLINFILLYCFDYTSGFEQTNVQLVN